MLRLLLQMMAGMDHERLESLFNFKKDETVKTPKLRHIGLNNVAQRLEFIFPGKHQFRVESQPGLKVARAFF